jgi:hypothetical protein
MGLLLAGGVLSQDLRGQPGPYYSQDEAQRTCRREVARRLNVRGEWVSTGVRRPLGPVPGNWLIEWRVNRGEGPREVGVCEVARDGRVIRFDRDERFDRDGRFDDNGPFDRGRRPPYTGNYPRVRVDTSGRGSFSGSLAATRITRGYVDTRGRPAVGLSGGGFRITFYGDIERSDGDREFTMRIASSDKGDARGVARVRLNRDRNEVESMDIQGRARGGEFNGNFAR